MAFPQNPTVFQKERKNLIMNGKYTNQYLILPAEDGTRADTKLAVEYSDDAIAGFLAQGYVLVSSDDFNKLIGNADKAYSIAMDGTLYETPPYEPSLTELCEQKVAQFKINRDEEEVLPIEYNGNSFDYDDKARDRINAAIIALDEQGEGATIEWTTADNQDVTVSAADLRGVIAAVAVRSNALHIKYRQLKAQCEAAQTVEELAQIVW